MYLIPLYPKECNFSADCCSSWFLVHWCSPSGDLTRWWHQILIILSPSLLLYIFQQSICSNWVTNRVPYSCIKHREYSHCSKLTDTISSLAWGQSNFNQPWWYLMSTINIIKPCYTKAIKISPMDYFPPRLLWVITLPLFCTTFPSNPQECWQR